MISRITVTMFVALASCAAASAHGFRLAATSHAGRLRVSAGYDTGEPAAGAAVTVVTASGEIAAAGLTDAAGVWVGELPPPGAYKVRADDGEGHGGRVNITIEAGRDLPPAAEPRPRWLGIAVGLSAIAALTLGLKWARRARARVAGAPPPTGRPPSPTPPDDAPGGLGPPPTAP